MALGLNMMLKSFGIDIDPEDIKRQVIAFQKNLADVITNFDGRLAAIETLQVNISQQQTAILAQQQTILEALNVVVNHVTSEVKPAGSGPNEQAMIKRMQN